MKRLFRLLQAKRGSAIYSFEYWWVKYTWLLTCWWCQIYSILSTLTLWLLIRLNTLLWTKPRVRLEPSLAICCCWHLWLCNLDGLRVRYMCWRRVGGWRNLFTREESSLVAHTWDMNLGYCRQCNRCHKHTKTLHYVDPSYMKIVLQKN